MAWYYIVLIIIGAHIPPLIALIIWIAIDDNDPRITKFFFPIIYLMEKRTEKKEEAKRKAEREAQERYDEERHYPKLQALRVSKEVISRFTVNPAPPNSIPLGHDMYKTEDGYIKICRTPVQVIYYERAFSEPINNYIIKHYEKISNKLKEEDITFVYMPRMLAYLQDSVAYSHPDASNISVSTYKPEDFYRELTAGIAKNPNEEPLLIVPDFFNNCGYSQKELEGIFVGCDAFILNYIDEEQFDYVFNRHLKTIIRKNIVRYSIAKAPNEEDIADYASISEIAKEIQDRINLLYAKGVSEYIISKIVSLPEPKLSTLLITKDFRIFLPDYNNMEIKMPTLSKALYFFYLRHPEGVLFKELRDHKAELSEIYRIISPLENMDKIEKSIDDIIDSTKNSVNEKCSRIKAAFVSQFNDNLAKNYYITGGAGEPKTIKLDKKLINDCTGLINASKTLKTNTNSKEPTPLEK